MAKQLIFNLPSQFTQTVTASSLLGIGMGFQGYMEYTLNGSSQLTNVDYWTNSGKGTKLCSKVITWTGTKPTTMTIKDETLNKTMTITLAYTGSTLTSVTKVLS
jgi:hypothetical protein